jgi:hypothetical protein
MCLASACSFRSQQKRIDGVSFVYLVESGLRAKEMTHLRQLVDELLVVPSFQWPHGGQPPPPSERLYSFQKLHLWNMTKYKRLLWFDPDVVWSGDPNRYFERYGHAAHLAAAEFSGTNAPAWWRKRGLRYLNSGILLLRPSRAEHLALLRRLAAGDFVSMAETAGGRGGGGVLQSQRRKKSEQDVIRSHFQGRWTPMQECDNFRGYIKGAQAGQAHCDPWHLIAWHGVRLQSKGAWGAACEASERNGGASRRHAPPLPKSFKAWESSFATTAATMPNAETGAAPVVDPLGYYRYRWVPPTDECGTELHADYDGTRAWNWGLDKTQHVGDAASCCAKCRAHAKCNSWVFCPEERCFSPDAHKHTKGECWLKDQRDPSSPSVNMRGEYTGKYRGRNGHHHAPPMVQWTSGTIRRTRPFTNGTWSGRAVW